MPLSCEFLFLRFKKVAYLHFELLINYNRNVKSQRRNWFCSVSSHADFLPGTWQWAQFPQEGLNPQWLLHLIMDCPSSCLEISRILSGLSQNIVPLLVSLASLLHNYIRLARCKQTKLSNYKTVPIFLRRVRGEWTNVHRRYELEQTLCGSVAFCDLLLSLYRCPSFHVLLPCCSVSVF